jgi:hypothetical protein
MNRIQAENARPGTADWLLTRPATARQIEGYASATSVNAGEPIQLFVHTSASRFDLEVFRMGWYQGLGARRVAGPIRLPGVQQILPTMDTETGLVDCDWQPSFALTTSNERTNEAWISGVYLARLTTVNPDPVPGAQSYILFVVRDDVQPAHLLLQLPVTTYQAYNNWGGKSLYHWGSSQGQRASQVSFNRPYAANAQNPAAALGMGAGEFLCNLQPHPDVYKVSNAGWDYNLVRWLERESFDVGYCTNIDTHTRPGLWQGHKAWLSMGHDEYWSLPIRQQFEAARDAGTHLAVFGANAAYWQIRLLPSASNGQANRVMLCFKKAKLDPVPARHLATDKWRSSVVGRPEEQLIGVMYAGDPVCADIVLSQASHWVFAHTGLQDGARLPGLLGYEVDSVQGHGPAGLQVLASSPWVSLTDPNQRGTAHMVLSTHASGAMVFATGSMQWAWGLDDFNAPGLRPSCLSPAAQQITRNVLRSFVMGPSIT